MINSEILYTQTVFFNEPLEPLKESHSKLLKRHHKLGERQDSLDERQKFLGEKQELLDERQKLLDERQKLLDDVETFIRQGRKAGTLLTRNRDRWDLQSILDYWVAILHRANRTPPDATLDELDEAQAPKFDDDKCPYWGFTAFAETDKSYFFGRQQLLDKLIAKLAQYPLVAVVGPSGSGASSLVFAGLLPVLAQGDEIAGRQAWHRYPTVVPGSNPLTSLVRALLSEHDDGGEDFAEQVQKQVDALQKDPTYVTRLLQAGLSDQKQALLIIDQFEEAFALCGQEKVCNAFIEALVALTQHPLVQVKIILTMRAAYRGRIARLQNDTFKEYFDQGLIQVSSPTDDELRAMILGPAEEIGLHIEPEVVEELIEDVRGEPSATYLLQDALARLWMRREYDWITMEAYRQLGGAKYALVQGAKQAYEALGSGEQAVARTLLLRLVQVGIHREAVSRRVLRSELLRNHQYQADEAKAVLEKLTQARVVRQSRTASPEDTQVELMHEALVQNWEDLRTWLWDDWEELRHRQRLTDKARLWEESGHSTTLLLQGGYLEEAETFTDLDPLERDYMQASLAAREQAKQREKRFYQVVIATLIAVIAVISILALVAWQARIEAEQAKNTANVRLASLYSSEAKQAVDIENTPQLGLLLAVEGVDILPEIDNITATNETLSAFQYVLTTTAGTPLRKKSDGVVISDVTKLAVSENGVWAAAGTTAGWLHGWNITEDNPDLTKFSYFVQEAPVTTIAFSRDGNWLAVGGVKGTVHLLDLRESPPFDFKPVTVGDTISPVTALAFAPQEEWLIAGTAAGDIYPIALASAEPLARPLLKDPDDQGIATLAFSPDGARLATVNISDTLYLWPLDPATTKPTILDEPPQRLREGKNGLIAFSPDGRWLTVGREADLEIYLYDLAQPDGLPFQLEGQSEGVAAISFTPDSDQLAIAGYDGVVRLWALGDMKKAPAPDEAVKPKPSIPPRETANDSLSATESVLPEPKDNGGEQEFIRPDSVPLEIVAHDGGVLDLSFKKTIEWDKVLTQRVTKTLLATAGHDQIVKYWDTSVISPSLVPGHDRLTPLETLRGHDSRVTSIFFGETPTQLLSSSDDGTVRFWDISQPRAPDDLTQLARNLDQWKRKACQRAGRDFHPNEKTRFLGHEAEDGSVCARYSRW